jgi:hypothetical protein
MTKIPRVTKRQALLAIKKTLKIRKTPKILRARMRKTDNSKKLLPQLLGLLLQELGALTKSNL